MKKSIKLALSASLLLGATSVLATNGSTLIGVGAKARAMGGATIGIGHGAESALSNPALITKMKKNHEISFGGTVFMPSVSVDNTLYNTSTTPPTPFNESVDSTADLFVIPTVSIANKVNDNFFWGIGIWGTAGMGVDYRDAKSITNAGTTMQMVTNVQIMQFGLPLAYTTNNFSIAITPILQYGALDINYEYPGNPNPSAPAAGTNFGTGVGQDLKMGVNVGIAYEISNLTIGAVYKSQIDMDYGNVMSKTISPFTQSGYTNEKLSTPAEIGVGVSYTMDQHTVAVDYKIIQWEDAKGYQDFNWANQSSMALGYQYSTKGWAARLGYNYSASPVEDQKPTFGTTGAETNPPNSSGISDGTANTFNLLGFPGIIESHVSIGGTYEIDDTTSIDATYVLSLENTEKFKNFAGANIETSHSQNAVTLQLNYAF